jgi:DNA-binding MarR family transcriptional regulator
LLVIEGNQDINLNEIAIKLNIDKAMVTRGIKKLVELGYVSKLQDEKDTRSYKLSLSKEGQETLSSLRDIFKDWFDKVTHNFTEEEKNLYITLMKRVHQNRIYK